VRQFVLCFLAALLAILIYRQLEPPVPRLIGHDCGGGGDVWAMEESDFPTPCRMIERNE
jgi:hypothetical protein